MFPCATVFILFMKISIVHTCKYLVFFFFHGYIRCSSRGLIIYPRNDSFIHSWMWIYTYIKLFIHSRNYSYIHARKYLFVNHLHNLLVCIQSMHMYTHLYTIYSGRLVFIQTRPKYIYLIMYSITRRSWVSAPRCDVYG